MFSSFKVELAAVDWTQFRWKLGLRRVPAILVLLIAAAAYHELAAGVLAAGAALSVGFASARPFAHSRVVAMTATAGCMAACGFLGILIGNSYPLTLAGAAVGGLTCACVALANEDTGWIAMQGVIAFLIAANFPGSLAVAGERAGCILLGGMVQTLSLSTIWHLQGIDHPATKSEAVPVEAAGIRNRIWDEFLKKVPLSKVVLRFSLRVAVTLVIAVELDHLLKLKNGYWLPMTTLIVLKPDFTRTYSGGVQSVAGTLAGAVLASLITRIFEPSPSALIVLVVFFCWVTFSTQKVNPVMFSAALTLFVVLLIALTGLPESSVVWHRLINTALGCALALTSHFAGLLVVRHALRDFPEVLADGPASKS